MHGDSHRMLALAIHADGIAEAAQSLRRASGLLMAASSCDISASKVASGTGRMHWQSVLPARLFMKMP